MTFHHHLHRNLIANKTVYNSRKICTECGAQKPLTGGTYRMIPGSSKRRFICGSCKK